MSKMLVAYAECGCRCGAILSGWSDPEAAEFVAEYEQDGLLVREEEHDTIGAHFCPKHRPVERAQPAPASQEGTK